jgi:hypothetical protein
VVAVGLSDLQPIDVLSCSLARQVSAMINSPDVNHDLQVVGVIGTRVAFRGAFGPHEGIVLEQATTAKAVARNHYLTLPPQCDLRNDLCAWRTASRIESY